MNTILLILLVFLVYMVLVGIAIVFKTNQNIHTCLNPDQLLLWILTAALLTVVTLFLFDSTVKEFLINLL